MAQCCIEKKHRVEKDGGKGSYSKCAGKCGSNKMIQCDEGNIKSNRNEFDPGTVKLLFYVENCKERVVAEINSNKDKGVGECFYIPPCYNHHYSCQYQKKDYHPPEKVRCFFPFYRFGMVKFFELYVLHSSKNTTFFPICKWSRMTEV